MDVGEGQVVNRVYLMRELYEKFLDGSLDPNVFGSEASL